MSESMKKKLRDALALGSKNDQATADAKEADQERKRSRTEEHTLRKERWDTNTEVEIEQAIKCANEVLKEDNMFVQYNRLLNDHNADRGGTLLVVTNKYDSQKWRITLGQDGFIIFNNNKRSHDEKKISINACGAGVIEGIIGDIIFIEISIPPK